jgi:hypothetical protein
MTPFRLVIGRPEEKPEKSRFAGQIASVESGWKFAGGALE